jgi:hypothetical protein
MTKENEGQEQQSEHAAAPEVEELARKLGAVGAAWARYGLTVGRAALETSAETLRTTSDLLGTVADRLDVRR